MHYKMHYRIVHSDIDQSNIVPGIHDTYKMFLEPLDQLDPEIIGSQKHMSLPAIAEEDLDFIANVDESKIREAQSQKWHVACKQSTVFFFEGKGYTKKFLNLDLLQELMESDTHPQLTGNKRKAPYVYTPPHKRVRNKYDDIC